MTKVCPNCKTSLQDSIQFCTTCGLNLALVPLIKPTKLLKGEKIYLAFILISAMVEIILFSTRKGDFFMNPLYFIAPLLLGFVKNEQYINYGTISSEFRKSVFLLIIFGFFMFIWESKPGNPGRDAVLIIFGPIIFAMILIMYFIINFVFYTFGHIMFKLFHKN